MNERAVNPWFSGRTLGSARGLGGRAGGRAPPRGRAPPQAMEEDNNEVDFGPIGKSVEDLYAALRVEASERIQGETTRVLKDTSKEEFEAAAKESLLSYLSNDASQRQLSIFMASIMRDADVRAGVRGPVSRLLRRDFVVHPAGRLAAWGTSEVLIGDLHRKVDAQLGGLISDLLATRYCYTSLHGSLLWGFENTFLPPTTWALSSSVLYATPVTADALAAVAEHWLRSPANVEDAKQSAKSFLLETIERFSQAAPGGDK